MSLNSIIESVIDSEGNTVEQKFSCGHNSLIMMPAWVEHGVSEVSIKDSDYYDGYGRYAITHFFGCKEIKS